MSPSPKKSSLAKGKELARNAMLKTSRPVPDIPVKAPPTALKPRTKKGKKQVFPFKYNVLIHLTVCALVAYLEYPPPVFSSRLRNEWLLYIVRCVGNFNVGYTMMKLFGKAGKLLIMMGENPFVSTVTLGLITFIVASYEQYCLDIIKSAVERRSALRLTME